MVASARVNRRVPIGRRLHTMRAMKWALGVAVFLAGVLCGGYLFADSVPRSVLAIGDCRDRCYRPNELAGLVASVAIRRAPFVIPGVALESDACIAIRHPKPEVKFHYVLFPKHDTRNLATLSDADVPFVIGCFALARELVERDHIQNWRVQTNGPVLQDVAYLHFHLIGR